MIPTFEMGGAVSSLHRLRNKFLIRLYKKGLVDNNNTIRSLFERDGIEEEGVHVITKSKLIAIIGIDSIDILEELFDRCTFQNDSIPLNFIIDFLENGLFTQTTMETVKKQISSASIYPEVRKTLGLLQPNEHSCAITVYNGVDKNDDKETPKENVVKGRSMWKKHETVIQERIVKQITVDKDGKINELITTDKSQNDIIHIESKLTGEFVHREYTQQEQTEELDKDMSTFIRATEEYIHLKSKEDEYEYLHSEVPPQSEQHKHDSDFEEESGSVDGRYFDDETLHHEDEAEYVH